MSVFTVRVVVVSQQTMWNSLRYGDVGLNMGSLTTAASFSPLPLSYPSAGSTATSSVYLTLKRLLLCTVELWCISLALLFTAAQSSWDGLCGASPLTKWVLHELEETKHFWPCFLTPACSETAFETGP